MCLEVLGKDAAVMRVDQMRMRTSKKKKPGRKSKKTGGKRGRPAKSGKKKVMSPPGRRRSVLARKKTGSRESLETSSKKEGDEKKEDWDENDAWGGEGWTEEAGAWDESWGDEDGEAWEGEWPSSNTVSRKRKPSTAKVCKKPAAKDHTPRSSSSAKAPAGKARAKAKAKSTAKAKASPKGPKPKASAKAKAKTKAKGKAAKPTAVPKAKGKAKAKARKNVARDVAEDTHTIEEWLQADYPRVLMDYALKATDWVDESLAAFKLELRDTLPLFEMTRLNLYWTRPACGITLKATGKDLCTFGFTKDSFPDLPHNLALALAIQSGVSYVSWLGCYRCNVSEVAALNSDHPVFAPHPALASGFEATFVDRLLKEVPEGATSTYRELGAVELMMAPELGQLRDIIKNAAPEASKGVSRWLRANRPDVEE